MNFYTKNIVYIYLFLAITFVASCNKELNVLPTTSAVDGNVITDSSSAWTVLNGIYYRFANGGVDFNNVPIERWFDVMELIPSELVGTAIYTGSSDGFDTYTFNSTTSSIISIWDYGYNIVNAANGFLKNISGVTSMNTSIKNEMEGEAKFLRAYANTTLLLSFGQYYDTTSQYGIILRTDFVNTTTLTLARSNVADCYSNILADLDYAIAYLPENNTSKIYANRAAAKLLKARVLINRGYPQDLENVVTITNDIIANEPFTIASSSKDIFQSNGLANNEVLLGVQPLPNQNWKFYRLQYQGTYSANYKDTILYADDPRNTWYYKNDQGGTNMGSSLDSILELSKYYSGNVVNPVITTLCEYSYAFRLSEAYLYNAEALASLNRDLTTAKANLKIVLKSVGFTNFDSIDAIQDADDLHFEIIKEEVKNFLLENGTDWYALRRLPLTEIAKIQPLLTSKDRFILPIPYAEITANNKIVQNPNY
ncbi:RagB/SusD family nutrient uptake outer membrane protein [Rhizosphaericola mali]|uniref:RagB/SusD family nutrient uptake outer membrane protein n=1 Tax=Rhizosphaericola mali TaxID=2545455 RepID=A0A5P2G942_9BACT|nr:RagB/SusD family nutrient uptake outer membrane protein [Rhizosphaericola mali]QES90230.1 RagB/SusD family nutrient uptake outer membrane protein [Rhizosphaericola mali]